MECSSLLSEFQPKKWLVTTKCASILTPRKRICVGDVRGEGGHYLTGAAIM